MSITVHEKRANAHRWTETEGCTSKRSRSTVSSLYSLGQVVRVELCVGHNVRTYANFGSANFSMIFLSSCQPVLINFTNIDSTPLCIGLLGFTLANS